MSSIGEQIKQARKTRGLTQEALAAQLNLTRQAISHWESGRTIPDAETLLKLSVLLNARFESSDPAPVPSSAGLAPSPSYSAPNEPLRPATEPTAYESEVSVILQREIRQNRILWIVLLSVLFLVCLVLLGFFLHSQKSSLLHMDILEPKVVLRKDSQLLGDLTGWEFTLTVENRSDIPFMPDRISVLLYKDDQLSEQTYISYNDLLPWMDSDKLRKNETPLHWLFGIREKDITHVVLILKGRDDNGHHLEEQLTVPLHHTFF